MSLQSTALAGGLHSLSSSCKAANQPVCSATPSHSGSSPLRNVLQKPATSPLSALTKAGVCTSPVHKTTCASKLNNTFNLHRPPLLPPFRSSLHISNLSYRVLCRAASELASTSAIEAADMAATSDSASPAASAASFPPQVMLRVAPPYHPTCCVQDAIRIALKEDFGDAGDISCLATVAEDAEASATFLAKADGVLAGVAAAHLVLLEVDPTIKVQWHKHDGDEVKKGEEFGSISGRARSLLTAERTALNFMQRMSGIATATRAMVAAAKPATILETRKTAPGLRVFDKWAVLIGGGNNHRMGLFDMVMVKDNHIEAAGGITRAVEATRDYLRGERLDVGVEVETRTLDEVREVMSCRGEGLGKVTRIMLDNMVVRHADGSIDVSMLEEALAIVGGAVETEASGNVTLETVGRIAQTGVTFISSGGLTHSVKALDISLNINAQLARAVGERTNLV